MRAREINIPGSIGDNLWLRQHGVASCLVARQGCRIMQGAFSDHGHEVSRTHVIFQRTPWMKEKRERTLWRNTPMAVTRYNGGGYNHRHLDSLTRRWPRECRSTWSQEEYRWWWYERKKRSAMGGGFIGIFRSRLGASAQWDGWLTVPIQIIESFRHRCSNEERRHDQLSRAADGTYGPGFLS